MQWRFNLLRYKIVNYYLHRHAAIWVGKKGGSECAFVLVGLEFHTGCQAIGPAPLISTTVRRPVLSVWRSGTQQYRKIGTQPEHCSLCISG